MQKKTKGRKPRCRDVAESQLWRTVKPWGQRRPAERVLCSLCISDPGGGRYRVTLTADVDGGPEAVVLVEKDGGSVLDGYQEARERLVGLMEVDGGPEVRPVLVRVTDRTKLFDVKSFV